MISDEICKILCRNGHYISEDVAKQITEAVAESDLRAQLEQAQAALDGKDEAGEALRNYCESHPVEIRDIPDEVWIPFTTALAITPSRAALDAVLRPYVDALRMWQAWTHITGIDKYPADCRKATDAALARYHAGAGED